MADEARDVHRLHARAAHEAHLEVHDSSVAVKTRIRSEEGRMSIKGALWGLESVAFLLFLFFRQPRLFWRGGFERGMYRMNAI